MKLSTHVKKNTSNIATRHTSVTEFPKPIWGSNNMPIPQIRCDLTLDDNIRLGDGGETSIQRVDLSGGKKSLKDETELKESEPKNLFRSVSLSD